MASSRCVPISAILCPKNNFGQVRPEAAEFGPESSKFRSNPTMSCDFHIAKFSPRRSSMVQILTNFGPSVASFAPESAPTLCSIDQALPNFGYFGAGSPRPDVGPPWAAERESPRNVERSTLREGFCHRFLGILLFLLHGSFRTKGRTSGFGPKCVIWGPNYVRARRPKSAWAFGPTWI